MGHPVQVQILLPLPCDLSFNAIKFQDIVIPFSLRYPKNSPVSEIRELKSEAN